MFFQMSARVAPENFNRHTDLSALDLFLNSLDKARSDWLAAGNCTNALRHAAQIARRQAEPSVSDPVVRVEAFQSDCVELRQPLRGSGSNAPRQEGGQIRFRNLFADHCGSRKAGQHATDKIGSHAASEHFALDFW